MPPLSNLDKRCKVDAKSALMSRPGFGGLKTTEYASKVRMKRKRKKKFVNVQILLVHLAYVNPSFEGGLSEWGLWACKISKNITPTVVDSLTVLL